MAGYMSAANSVGCLTGALLSTFVLVPAFGSEVSLKLIIVVLAVFWAAFFRYEGSPRKSRTMVMAGAISVLLLCSVTWHWDWSRITSGWGQYFGENVSKAGKIHETMEAAVPTTSTTVFKHEAMQGGFTTVVETTAVSGNVSETRRILTTDGKFLGSDTFEYVSQLGMAVLPSLFVRHLDRVLQIGLGSGPSANVLRQLGFQDIRIAEFSPDVVAAAACCFQSVNQKILSDPKVTLYLEDGRNVMLTRPDTFDLITIQINAIWYAGATNVFSREFY